MFRAYAQIVVLDLGRTGPVRGLVAGELAGRRVDAESEEPVELRMERRNVERITRDQVPVEGFDVPQVKDDAMAFGDRPFVEGVRMDELE